MGNIYFNLNSKGINYLDEAEINAYDILLSDMAKKIVLSSMNNVKMFPTVDVLKENEQDIKKLIRNGYRPVNSDMELFLGQNYNFCPRCGNDIDINTKVNYIIYDVGLSLANLAKKNIYPAKEIRCPCCEHSSLYYYNIYADKEDRVAFAKQAVNEGASIYIRFRYCINADKKAELPIMFDFNQFTLFFNKANFYRNEKNFEMREIHKNDVMSELVKGDDGNILRMLFNTELHEILQTESDMLVDNLRVTLSPIRIGLYNSYTTENDYELLQRYASISSSRERLIEFISNKQ